MKAANSPAADAERRQGLPSRLHPSLDAKHDPVDAHHEGQGHQHRTDHVHALPDSEADVLDHQDAAEDQGGDADGHIDEEDPVPAQCLGEHTAGEEADGAAPHGDEDVGAHRLGSLHGFGNLVTMMATITEADSAPPMPWTKRAVTSMA